MSALTERRNGVETTTLFATIDALRHQPETGAFKVWTITEWVAA